MLVFLVDLKTLKEHYEINWPLRTSIPILSNLFVFVSGVRFLTLKVNPEGLPLKMKKTTNDIPMAKQEKRLRVENPGYSGWRIEL